MKELAIESLAAYEDTGLKPEEINRFKWISVKDRLPDKDDLYLTIVSGKPQENIELIETYMLGEYWHKWGWCLDEYPDWEKPNVTHWMPLPEPPKER